MGVLFAISLCFWLSAVGGQITEISLNGQWTVYNAARGITVSGQVPGSIYTALLDSGKIADPLYRDNDVQLAWIGRENWTYIRQFNVSDPVINAPSINLVAEGIDTISTIYINDVIIGQTNNMYLKYVFDMKSYLRNGINNIRINFESAVKYAADKASNLTYDIPPDCPSPVQHGECHVNMIRKEPCSFSWDWGPSFPTQGIWKPIYIQAVNGALIQDVSVQVMPGDVEDSWLLEIKIDFSMSDQAIAGDLTVNLSNTGISRTYPYTLLPSDPTIRYVFMLDQSERIQRWWPNGYGDQVLYNLTVAFTSKSYGETSSRTLRIGFRTIELVQDPVSSNLSQGLSFYFRVNKLPIFFKGSNWIPADSFQERITKDRLRNLLQSAATAHINSMRVWGGGVYESEDFYDLTDELGIMIWQDLMYSDALYPSDAEFLQLVSQEVTYQVKRLRHRASIVIWSGNNENEGILRAYGSKPTFPIYYKDFIKVYVDTIMKIVDDNDASRPFVTSSPSNGVESVREGFVAQDPGSEFYGDIHFYDYSINQWVPDLFRIPRFASEFGIEAWCNYYTLMNVFGDDDMDPGSAMADHRQHHDGGASQMQSQYSIHLNVPPQGNAPKPFRSTIYLTQINQAMSIKSQSEHYRRHQSTLLPDGRGLTMGALYWQLNDIWQAPTWASVDYSGRWKMLHYFAVKFFSPELVSPYIDGDSLNVYVVMDEMPIAEFRESQTNNLGFKPVSKFPQKNRFLSDISESETISGILTIEMYNWTSLTPIYQWVIPYELKSTAESVFRQNLNELMNEAGCTSPTYCFIHVYLQSGTDNWLSLAELRNSALQPANISIVNVTQDADDEFSITISTTAIAPFVWLESGTVLGRFSDNGFLILQPTLTVHFYAWEPVSVAVLREMLNVTSVLDIYK